MAPPASSDHDVPLQTIDENPLLTSPAKDKPKIPDGGWGWMVVFASLMLVLIECGIAFTFGILFVELVDEFQVSSAAIAWIGSLFVSVPLLTGPIMSALVDKYGCRTMTIVGGLISTVGFLLSSLARSVGVMCLTFGILAALGFGLNYITAVVCIPYWFEKRRTLAFGLGACGIGIGTFLYAPFTTYLVEEYKWRGTLVILSGTVLNMCVCGFLMRDPDWLIEQNKANAELSKKTLQHGHPGCSERPGAKGPAGDRVLESVEPIQRQHRSAINLTTFARQDERHQQEPLLLNYQKELFGKNQPIARTSSVPWLSEQPSEANHHPNGLRYRQPSRHSLMYQSGILYKTKSKDLHSLDMYKIGSAATIAQNRPWYSVLLDALKEVFDFSLFCELHFFLMAISTVTLFAWFMTPYFYLADHLTINNFSSAETSLVISVIGITNTIGMVALGWAGDQPWVHVTKTYAVCLMLCGVFCSALILFTANYAMLIVSAGLYGLALASCFTFTPQILVELLPLEKFTTAYGLTLFCQGVGHLVGPPIAGYMFDVTQKWDYSFHVSGVWIVVAGFLVLAIPYTKNRKLIGHGPIAKDLANERV